MSQSALGATSLGTLGRAAAVGAGGLIATSAHASKKLKRMRPQPGDELVFAFGDKPHEPVSVASLEAGAPPVLAVPREPGTALVRDGSRLNNLAVVRLAESALPVSAKTARHAAGDVIVFSAVCTHTGCTVEKWNADAQHLICPCHQSEFKVADAAKVVNGPAPKPLAMLPVKVENDRLVVTGKFSRRVGIQPQQ
ncbi:MAG: Rieske (2Fe-2S) protein [Gammaproteobacteria bacterium]|nr:Rieske (2Fe-2S) protein [Gammaproteobacteria bacterium]